MKPVLATQSASISELKRNPSALISNAHGSPIVVLNHNKPTAYLIPAATYESLLEKLDDKALQEIVSLRLKDVRSAVEVSIDEL